jgi:hypothetical protein
MRTQIDPCFDGPGDIGLTSEPRQLQRTKRAFFFRRWRFEMKLSTFYTPKDAIINFYISQQRLMSNSEKVQFKFYNQIIFEKLGIYNF